MSFGKALSCAGLPHVPVKRDEAGLWWHGLGAGCPAAARQAGGSVARRGAAALCAASARRLGSVSL